MKIWFLTKLNGKNQYFFAQKISVYWQKLVTVCIWMAQHSNSNIHYITGFYVSLIWRCYVLSFFGFSFQKLIGDIALLAVCIVYINHLLKCWHYNHEFSWKAYSLPCPLVIRLIDYVFVVIAFITDVIFLFYEQRPKNNLNYMPFRTSKNLKAIITLM